VTKIIVQPDDKLLLVTFSALWTSDVRINAVIHKARFSENDPYEVDFFFSR
jgi:hypothetical protein